MNKREFLLCTVGLPFVVMLVIFIVVLMLVFGDPLDEGY